MDVSKYMGIFLVEAREHLGDFERKLAVLEVGKEPSREVAAEMFRHAHSLKGMAASMDLGEISRLGLALEGLLGRVKNRELIPDRRLLDLLRASTDYLRILIDETEAGGRTVSRVDDLVRAIAAPCFSGEDAAVPGGTPPTASPGAIATAPPAGGSAPSEEALVRVEANLDPAAQLPAARLFLVYTILCRAGRIVHANPPLEEVRSGGAFRGFEVVLLGRVDADALRGELAAVSELRQVVVSVLDPAALSATGPRDVVAFPGLGGGDIRWGAVRLEADLLDELTTLAGELSVVATGMRPAAGVLLGRLSKLVMGLRTLPLDLTGRRLKEEMGRLLETHGRSADFHAEGMEVELDRALVSRIEESLAHLVGNAVRHGLETPEERLSAGKQACGAVRFAARREQEWIRLEIADDGRGMPGEVVSMVNGGAPSADGAAGSLRTIRDRIASLGGLMSLSAVPGQGTMVVIRLPFMPTFMRVLVAGAGGMCCGVPAGRVLRTAPAAPDRAQRIDVAEALGRAAGTPAGGGTDILVGDVSGTVALRVDDLAGNRDVVVDFRPAEVDKHPFCLAMARLDDGRFLTILDVDRLIRGA